LVKRIQIHSDDRTKPVLTFVITGRVEKFATIEPQYIRLTGKAGSPLYAQVNITPEASHPFKIVSSRVKKGDFIRFSVKDRPAPDHQSYLLTVENTLDKKGRYFDTIFLKTTSPIHPELKISVFGNIMESDDVNAKGQQ
jgi:hypothetical protein